MPRPEIVAHRGLPREARENTLASFSLALEAGSDAIELDVHATADGVVVVHHDPVLHALPGATARDPIAELTHEQVRMRSPDDWPIPTLHEVLELVGLRARVYVEVKAPAIESLVCDALAAHHCEAAVHSFDHRISSKVRSLAPRLPVGVLMSSYLLDPSLPISLTGARDLWQQWELIDFDLVDRVHAVGGRVVAWTVNATADASRLADLGVDALCTDVTRDLTAIGKGATRQT
jgi:glycerophosphoryl diester phosphodiesterase